MRAGRGEPEGDAGVGGGRAGRGLGELSGGAGEGWRAAEAQGGSASGVWCLPAGSQALASVRSGLALSTEVSSGEGGWGE